MPLNPEARRARARLAAHRSFRYVNLECALGERDAQTERVNWLEANLPHNY